MPDAAGCIRCRDEAPLPVALRMAFQPIVDVAARDVFAYEALVRGAQGEGAAEVIARIEPAHLYRFDQTCRVLAIATAARLGLRTWLSINVSPNAVYEPAACIRLTLAAAERVGFPTDRLMFELNEGEHIADPAHLLRVLRDYQQRGFLTAIDDFGAGYAGLTLLARFQPDVLKLDIALVRGIDTAPAQQAIAATMVDLAARVGSRLVAEGVETRAELDTLRALGVVLFQGYLFARPALEALPEPDWSVLD
ncbi:EAL domain-containing protein [Tolypothrix campylonemoides VB511288]|nr:EAL domain-containing protein [Tolypothrix campylonemoides VB511288]